MEKKLIPYSLYLPADLITELKKLAKTRKASSVIRDSLVMAIKGNDSFKAGYKKGLHESINQVQKCADAKNISVKGIPISETIVAKIKRLDK